jgi:putative flavoprotein involved in K+ transport
MLPVIIVGAGPAGLATAAELGRRRVPHRLLERGESLGTSWVDAYDSLTLHTGKHLSALPRRRFPRQTSLFPTRLEFLAYLRDYARAFALRVETGCDVREAVREGDRWIVRVDGSDVPARSLVMATGIMANPRLPHLPGVADFGGDVLHSVAYRRPAPFVGRRVLVVGVGNSGGEIASELARAGAHVTVLVRTGANVVPRALAGIPIQYLAWALRALPRGARQWIAARVQRRSGKRRGPPVLPRPPWSALDAIPLIGFHLVDAIREGLVRVQPGGIARVVPGAVRFTDGTEAPFDVVLCATGFAPAIDALGDRVRRDARGFALRTDRVTSADQPRLWFVGHNYDATGGLANIRRDAVEVAGRIAAG